MEYLMEVLSINRHLCVYSGETVKPDEPVEEADVWELVKEQIQEICGGVEEKACQVLEARRDGEVVGLVVRIGVYN